MVVDNSFYPHFRTGSDLEHLGKLMLALLFLPALPHGK